jgi:hypothetical protein
VNIARLQPLLIYENPLALLTVLIPDVTILSDILESVKKDLRRTFLFLLTSQLTLVAPFLFGSNLEPRSSPHCAEGKKRIIKYVCAAWDMAAGI